MSDDKVTSQDEPFDRLTRLTAEMTTVLDLPENNDVRAIVFLSDNERGGIQIHGYNDENEALVELFIHMQAIFRSMGKELSFVGIPDSPEGLS